MKKVKRILIVARLIISYKIWRYNVYFKFYFSYYYKF